MNKMVAELDEEVRRLRAVLAYIASVARQVGMDGIAQAAEEALEIKLECMGEYE